MFSPAKLIPLERFKFLIKDTFIFGLAQGISRSFAIITFPIVSRNLNVSEYGVLDLFLTISGFIAIFLIFGQDSAVARFIYDTKNTKLRKQIISQSLQIQILLSIIILPILAFISKDLDQFFKIDNFSLYFNIILMTIPCMVLINFSQNILKWTFDRKNFLFLTIGFSFTQALFLSFAVFYLDFNVITALLINLLSNIIFSIIGIIFVKKWITFKFEKFYKTKLIVFAIPIGIACIIESFMPVIERQLILKYLNLHDLGIYAAATKIAMIIALLIGAFQICWDPMALSIFKEKNASKTYNQVSKNFCILVCIAVLFIDLLSENITVFFASDRYLEASYLVFPLCMAFAVKSLGGITNIGISLSKKTYFYLISYLCSITIFFISFFYLIPLYGSLAIAYSILISQIVKAVISTFIAQFVYPISWDYKPLIIIPSITLIFGLVANYGDIENDLRIFLNAAFLFFLSFYFMFSLNKIFKKGIN